jgi:1,4-alpha-glucan branching enzyme
MSDFHRCVRDLIHLRHRLPALRADGFRVFHIHDANRVLAFHRWVPGEGQDVVIVANLSEHTHYNYQLGFPRSGRWAEVFNSDAYDHWVNPWVQGNGGGIFVNSPGLHGFSQSAAVTLPANSIIAFA